MEMSFYAKGEPIKGTGHYNSNNHWVEDTMGTTLVSQHCADVGLTCKKILEGPFFESVTKYLSKHLNISTNDVISLLSFLSSCHDVGKIHPLFQKNFKNSFEIMKVNKLILSQQANQKIRHEVISRYVMCDFLKNKLKINSLVEGLLYTLSSHHEKDKNYMNGRLEEIRKEKEFWKDSQDSLVEELYSYFPVNLDILNNCNLKVTDKVCLVFFMILVLSDWIASSYLSDNYIFYNNCQNENDMARYFYVTSQKLDAIFVKELGLISQKNIDLSTYEKILNVKNPELRPVQEELKAILKNTKFKLLLIEAPMGEGKTEAGLYAAGHMGIEKDGVLITLPTGATANMMYDRMLPLLNEMGVTSLNLLHGTSFVRDKLYTTNIEDSKNFLSSSRTGLFISNCVSTVDQIMMGVLKAKFAPLRLLGAMNKVLIIDEVHAYDAYMQGILDILLSWCNILEIPVVLLTATLPNNIKQQLISSFTNVDVILKENGYPLITGVTMTNAVKEYEIKNSYMKKMINFKSIQLKENYDALLQSIEEKLETGNNIGVICNTVKESIKLEKVISERFPDNECILIHSKYTVETRLAKEKYIKSKLGKLENPLGRSKGLIVIGTQVLEQSLDIDFDTMYSMICPIDLLLQRLGRWRRFALLNRKEDNEFYVVYNYNENGYDSYHYVYPQYLLKRTEQYVTEHPTCILPDDFRPSLSFVYENTDLNDSDYIAMISDNAAKRSLGGLATICKDMGEISQRSTVSLSMDIKDDFDFYPTRMGRSQVKMIFLLPEDKDTYDLKSLSFVKDRDLAIKLVNKSFSVPYDNLPIEDESRSSFIESGGLLSGYRLCFVTQISDEKMGISIPDNEKTENRYLHHLQYSKKYGYLYKKEKLE